MKEKIDYGIRCSKISKDCKELKELVGFAWETNAETLFEFNKQREFKAEFIEGNICCDLINMENGDLIDTITISNSHFQKLTGGRSFN